MVAERLGLRRHLLSICSRLLLMLLCVLLLLHEPLGLSGQRYPCPSPSSGGCPMHHADT